MDAFPAARVLPNLCPRCDYDLRGEIDTWITECPLVSRCPECGLEVHWNERAGEAPPPPWSFEHALPQRWPLIRAWLGSTARAFLPRTLWRGLRLALPLNFSRLLVMNACFLFAFYAIAVAVMIAMIALETALERSAVNQVNIAYTAAKLSYQSAIPAPLEERLVMEWSRWAFPFFDLGRGVSPVTLPMVLVCLVLLPAMPATLAALPFSLRKAKVKGRHLVRLSGYWALWAGPLALVPAFFGSIYSMIWPLVTILAPPNFAPNAPAGPTWIPATLNAIAARSNIVVMVILAVLMHWFWWNACKHYLKLPRPFFVALAQVAIALLFAAAAGFFLFAADDLITQLFYELLGR